MHIYGSLAECNLWRHRDLFSDGLELVRAGYTIVLESRP
jgi:hypothetical protein